MRDMICKAIRRNILFLNPLRTTQLREPKTYLGNEGVEIVGGLEDGDAADEEGHTEEDAVLGAAAGTETAISSTSRQTIPISDPEQMIVQNPPEPDNETQTTDAVSKTTTHGPEDALRNFLVADAWVILGSLGLALTSLGLSGLLKVVGLVAFSKSLLTTLAIDLEGASELACSTLTDVALGRQHKKEGTGTGLPRRRCVRWTTDGLSSPPHSDASYLSQTPLHTHLKRTGVKLFL
ncbi:hypothetical protein BDK51DRAFT_40828 [Blyttiomyces helicus]|uniref:Uncharacterized protein n=1 Tax=Blyttiomyces helicus TaxID=388810 RepID=A0A4P9W5A0_9FUNG|nr:hypothetical protein BDK51DRAFT_40828 [Blyttiomyces helicus]|eukprot:RKO87424.1 hypothetical protein BDK51DRAFT_40828 [Blyttiomyces helicus]